MGLFLLILFGDDNSGQLRMASRIDFNAQARRTNRLIHAKLQLTLENSLLAEGPLFAFERLFVGTVGYLS